MKRAASAALMRSFVYSPKTVSLLSWHAGIESSTFCHDPGHDRTPGGASSAGHAKLKGFVSLKPDTHSRKRPLAAILQLRDAIKEFVHDGDTVALEGFTHLIPFAAGHEIIRQQRKNLTLVRMTPDVIYDQLIGTGCASKLVFSWGGNPGVG